MEDYIKSNICPLPWTHLEVDVNGGASPCCLYKGSVPDVKVYEQSLTSIHKGKLALAGCKWNEPYGNEVIVFDFDPNSGEASNMNVFDIYKAFGAEFSPDGSKLYVTS